MLSLLVIIGLYTLIVLAIISQIVIGKIYIRKIVYSYNQDMVTNTINIYSILGGIIFLLPFIAGIVLGNYIELKFFIYIYYILNLMLFGIYRSIKGLMSSYIGYVYDSSNNYELEFIVGSIIQGNSPAIHYYLTNTIISPKN